MSRKRDAPWIFRVGAMQRLAASLGAALLAFLVEPGSASWHARVVASWDMAVVTYLGFAWVLVSASDAKATRDHVLSQDLRGYLIFLFVVGASCASIVALGFAVGPIRDLPFWSRAWHLLLTVAALVLSWLLIHTVFAFHYAHRFYAGPHSRSSETPSLQFPGGREPDFMDFMYYAFVVGMTSQVADVGVASKSMRRLTMVHGVIAFVFNIAVLALSINIFASVL